MNAQDVVPADPPADNETVSDGPWFWTQMDFNEFKKSRLVEGADYGIAKDRRTGREIGDKPSLFQPGAEKIAAYFLRARSAFEMDKDTWQMLGSPEGVVCYRCILISTVDGATVLGEGRGACNQADRGGRGFGGAGNSAIKMAEKSALVDAVKRVAALSGAFTQDVEEPQTGAPPPRRPPSQPQSRPPQGPPPDAAQEPIPETVTELIQHMLAVNEQIKGPGKLNIDVHKLVGRARELRKSGKSWSDVEQQIEVGVQKVNQIREDELAGEAGY